MQYTLNYTPPANPVLIQHTEPIMLIGSCFTQHIGNYLAQHKYSVLQNPNGILFDTQSVCSSLTTYLHPKKYVEADIFFHNELWHSWQYHGMYSNVSATDMLQKLNAQHAIAYHYLHTTKWLCITLGSSFAYQLKQGCDYATPNNNYVANCHKVPQQHFNKVLLTIQHQVALLDNVLYRIKQVNPNIQVVFTISPVRHIRDGVVENNRSKARLLEVVHHLVSKFENLYYFAAYELVIDVLRDYRFYDIDMVHPNYAATNYVIEQFENSFLSPAAIEITKKIKPIINATHHKPFNPNSNAHKLFLQKQVAAIAKLKVEYPYINFENEQNYFNSVLRASYGVFT